MSYIKTIYLKNYHLSRLDVSCKSTVNSVICRQKEVEGEFGIRSFVWYATFPPKCGRVRGVVISAEGII